MLKLEQMCNGYFVLTYDDGNIKFQKVFKEVSDVKPENLERDEKPKLYIEYK